MASTVGQPLQQPNRHGFDLSRPVLVLVAAILVVLVALPLFWLAVYSLTRDDGGGFTLANFVALATDPALSRSFGISLAMAAAVAAISCAVATPLAWLVARTELPGRGAIRALVTASFVTPPFLGAIAWEILAAPNTGLINQAWRWLLGLAPYDEPLVDIYTFSGLVFAIACNTYPYTFTLIANALDRIPADVEDASAILGGGALRTLRRVTLPLAAPAILAGVLVAFLQALTMFGSPAILALPAGFHVITTKIWSLFQFPPKPGLAAAAALPLLVITVLLLWAQARVLGRRGYETAGGKSGTPRLVRLGRWRLPALGFAALVLLVTVVLPYLALAKAAFSQKVSDPLGLSTMTLQHARFVLFELSATRLAISNTLVLGLATATLGTLLALVVAYLAGRRVVPGARVLGWLANAPMAIPGIVLGVGLFLAWSRPPFVLYGTLWILLIGFLTIELPAGYQQLNAAFRAVNIDLEEASRMLGASRLRTLLGITAPLIGTSVIATWCFIFIGTVRELSATILLTTAETKLVSVVIYDLNEAGEMGAIAVLGLMLLALTFAIVWLVNRLPRGARASARDLAALR